MAALSSWLILLLKRCGWLFLSPIVSTRFMSTLLHRMLGRRGRNQKCFKNSFDEVKIAKKIIAGSYWCRLL